MVEAAIAVLVLLVALGGTVLLWYAIEGETADIPRMSRSEAERVARQDTDEEE